MDPISTTVDNMGKFVEICVYLAKRKERSRRKLFDNFVEPLYSAFALVHKDYLESFQKYRNLIRSSDGSLENTSSILDSIGEDNLFTADKRAGIIEFSKLWKDAAVYPFIRSIREYLVSAMGEHDLKPTSTEHYVAMHTQRWRRGLRLEWSCIFREYWNGVLDPYASHAPFDEDETKVELERLCQSFNIDASDPHWIEKLKVALAVDALDRRVEEMQTEFSKVTHEFYALRLELTPPAKEIKQSWWKRLLWWRRG